MPLRPNQIKLPSKKLSDAPAWVKSILKDHLRRLSRLATRKRATEEQLELFNDPVDSDAPTASDP